MSKISQNIIYAKIVLLLFQPGFFFFFVLLQSSDCLVQYLIDVMKADCLVPDIREKAFSLSTLNMMLAVGYLIYFSFEVKIFDLFMYYLV